MAGTGSNRAVARRASGGASATPVGAGAQPFTVGRRGARLDLRVTPKASRAGVGGIEIDADGRARLKLKVGAPPEGGRANRAVIKLLAGELKLPASSFRISAGAKNRRKTVEIAGDPAALNIRLTEWISKHG